MISFFKNHSAFTLLEILISTSLVLIILTLGIKTFDYFSAEARLSEARELVDTQIATANINALTGKSSVADYYKQKNSSSFQISRYFLYFKKSDSWDEVNTILYGELQKGFKAVKTDSNSLTKIIHEPALDSSNNELEYYELVQVKHTEIPFPVYLVDIFFEAQNAERKSLETDSGIFIFFDPPFAKVSFLEAKDVMVKKRTGEALSSYKNLLSINEADYSKEIYLDFSAYEEKKGELELVLQFKDREVEGEDENYWLQEYIKYDSQNQLSHYWD